VQMLLTSGAGNRYACYLVLTVHSGRTEPAERPVRAPNHEVAYPPVTASPLGVSSNFDN
jgi:hypothetical protein